MTTKINSNGGSAEYPSREGTRAYTPVIREGGFQIGLAVEGEPGYYPASHTTVFKSYEEAVAFADDANKRLGLSPDRAQEIITSTFRAQNEAEGRGRGRR